jgi:hypothetical protein
MALGCRGVSCRGFSASTTASWGKGAFSAFNTQTRHEQGVFRARIFDEFVQWMVQDASPDR